MVEDVLDTIGDPRAREVLIELSKEKQSASDLADTLGYAPSTIYSHLDELMDHNLVDSEMQIAADGNHYKRYRCNFESTLISIEDDEYDVRIYRRDNLPDRFSQLWDDLSGE